MDDNDLISLEVKLSLPAYQTLLISADRQSLPVSIAAGAILEFILGSLLIAIQKASPPQS
jgi:hypothetical protein